MNFCAQFAEELNRHVVRVAQCSLLSKQLLSLKWHSANLLLFSFCREIHLSYGHSLQDIKWLYFFVITMGC